MDKNQNPPKAAKKKLTRPAVTINTDKWTAHSNHMIGSAFYPHQNPGVQTAQAQTSTTQSFAQIQQKKTPTNKTSSQFHQGQIVGMKSSEYARSVSSKNQGYYSQTKQSNTQQQQSKSQQPFQNVGSGAKQQKINVIKNTSGSQQYQFEQKQMSQVNEDVSYKNELFVSYQNSSSVNDQPKNKVQRNQIVNNTAIIRGSVENKPQGGTASRNAVGKMMLKSRVDRGEKMGPNPRNDSGNSGGRAQGNSLFDHNTGNITTNSNTCNQSFQVGQQKGQALVRGNSKSKGRGGSSGSNQRTKGRYRSGSNKNTTKSKLSKEVNNPQITIQTNGHQMMAAIGASACASTKTAQAQGVRDFRESTYMTHHISTTKNCDKAQMIQFKTKTAVTPGAINEKVDVQNQQSKKIKQPLKTGDFSNLYISQSREPATTKSCKVEGGTISIKNSNVGSIQKRNQNLQIINQGRFPGTSKNGPIADGFSMKQANAMREKVSATTHSNILNKLGKQNPINQKTMKAQGQQNVKKIEEKQNSRAKGITLNTTGSEGCYTGGNPQTESKGRRRAVAPTKSQQSAMVENGQDDTIRGENFSQAQIQDRKNGREDIVTQSILNFQDQKIGPTRNTHERKGYETMSSESLKAQVQAQNSSNPRVHQAITKMQFQTSKASVTSNMRLGSKSGQRKSSERQASYGKQNATAENIAQNKKKRGQKLLQQSLEDGKNNMTGFEDGINASTDFCDQKSQGSLKSRYSKQSKKMQGKLIKHIVEATNEEEIVSQISSNQSQKFASANPSSQQLSYPNLTNSQKYNQMQKMKQMVAEKHQQIFYQDELKKRDDIVLYLCEKVQNMESQIELLRTQQNKSSIQNLSGLTSCPGPSNGSRTLACAESQQNINRVNGQSSPLNSSGQYVENQKHNLSIFTKQDHLNFYPKFGGQQEHIEEEQSLQDSRLSNQKVINMKLNDTSDNEYDVNDVAPIQDCDISDQYENTAGFYEEEQPIQEDRGDKSQQRIANAFNVLQDNLDRYKKYNNPKKIADLRKYCATSITQNSKNNTGRISSRLHDSSGGTGRLKHRNSKGNGGTSGSNTNKTKSNGTNTQHNRTTNRHFQSTSDAEINSLVTVGEDFSKFTRASNHRASDRHILDPVGKEGSPFVQSESTQNVQFAQKYSKFKLENEADNSLNLAETGILAQGGVCSNEDPLLVSAVGISDDNADKRCKVIIYDEPVHNDLKRGSNPFAPCKNDSVLIENEQHPHPQFHQRTNFDPDLAELQKLVGYQQDDQENSTMLNLQNEWKKHHQNPQQLQDKNSGLSKTLSKETLIQRLKKANIKNTGERIPIKNSKNGNMKVQFAKKLPKFKLLQTKKNNFVQQTNDNIGSMERQLQILEQMEKNEVENGPQLLQGQGQVIMHQDALNLSNEYGHDNSIGSNPPLFNNETQHIIDTTFQPINISMASNQLGQTQVVHDPQQDFANNVVQASQTPNKRTLIKKKVQKTKIVKLNHNPYLQVVSNQRVNPTGSVDSRQSGSSPNNGDQPKAGTMKLALKCVYIATE